MPFVHAAESGIGDKRVVGSLPFGGSDQLPFAPFPGRRFLLAQNGLDNTTGVSVIDMPSDEMTFWEWLRDYLYRGASLTVGIGTRQAELKLTRKTDGAIGKLVERDEEAYFISYSTRPSFFGRSKLGYTFMLNYSTFSMDKQEISKDVYEDLGTSVRGRTAYVVPSFFYQWGQHEPHAKFVRLGIGIGLGIAKYRGDVLLTEPLPYEGPIPVSNGSYDLKAAVGGFLEARYRFIGLTFSGAGPSYQDETYKYDARNIAVYLGVTHYF